MKISELNTKSFLGASGAAENSYVLINYEDETTNEPVTYKATVQELGKAIANKLQLTTNGQNGLATVKSSNGAWASEDKGQLVTAAEKTKIANAASTGAITAAVSGLASTGYVTAAVANAGGGGFNPTTPVTCSVIDENATFQENLYPAMIMDGSGVQLWVQSQISVGKFISGGVLASVNDLNGMACIGSSDNRPCIRDKNREFIGFLSTT